MDVGLSIIMNHKLPIVPSWRFGQWKEGTEKGAKAINKKRDEIIKDLGEQKEDGSIEVLPKNKQTYYEQYKKLMDEKPLHPIAIPEIQVSLIEGIPLNVRFTTLIGHYLKHDGKFPKEKYAKLTHQQIIDMDLGLSIIMNEPLPTQLALKLGEAKRTAEVISNEFKDFRENLTKTLGELNESFEYEVKTPENQKKFDEALEKWLESKPKKPIEIPIFYLSDFQTTLPSADKNKKGEELKLPSRFFALFGPYIKEKKEEKVEKEVEAEA